MSAQRKNFVEHSGEYISTQLNLQVAKLALKLARSFAVIAAAILVLTAGLFSLVLSGVALAIWIGKEVNSYFLGFVTIALIFFNLFICFSIFTRDTFIRRLRNKLVKLIF